MGDAINEAAPSRDVSAKSLRLYVHGGEVWEAYGERLPRNTNATVSEYVQAGSYTRRTAIQLIGCKSNAKLIVKLSRLYFKGDIATIQLCSPLCTGRNPSFRDPAYALWCMPQWLRAPSQGGFRPITYLDSLTFQLTSNMSAATDDIPHFLETVVSLHPVVRMLGLFDVSSLYSSQFVAEIMDPRWYVDFVDPNRMSKYMNYLGLIPRIQRQVSVRDIRSMSHRRCLMISNMWQQRRPSPIDMLHNMFLSLISDASNSDDAVIELRVSKKLATYARLVWLDIIYAGKRGGERLFCPELYFDDDIHVEQFNSLRREVYEQA